MFAFIKRYASFLSEVKKEFSKLKFPTRSESSIFLIAVIVMASISALFFFVVDSAAYKTIDSIISYFVS